MFTPSDDDRPAENSSTQSLSVVFFLHLRHRKVSNDPWQCTTLLVLMPAASSKPSMFCVYMRPSFRLCSRSRKNQWVLVGYIGFSTKEDASLKGVTHIYIHIYVIKISVTPMWAGGVAYSPIERQRVDLEILYVEEEFRGGDPIFKESL